MKKIILTPVLLILIQFMSFSENYIPDVWIASYYTGITEYLITNSEGQKLSISCPYGETILNNGVRFEEINGKLYDEEEFALKIDGNAYYLPDSKKEFYTLRDDRLWYAFREAISKGEKIEVYMNSKSVALFTPSEESIREHIAFMEDCSLRSEKL